MPNPNWQKGVSGNPHGRPARRGKKSIAIYVEQFLKRNLTPKKLQALFDKLAPKEKAVLLCDLLPYGLSRKPSATAISFNQLSDEQIDELYNQVLTSAALSSDDDESAIIPFTEIKTLGNGTRG